MRFSPRPVLVWYSHSKQSGAGAGAAIRPGTPTSLEDSVHSGTTVTGSEMTGSDDSAYNETAFQLALFDNRKTSLKVEEAKPRKSCLSKISFDLGTISSTKPSGHNEKGAHLSQRDLKKKVYLKIKPKQSPFSYFCRSVFFGYRGSSFKIYEGSLNQPRMITSDRYVKAPLIRLNQLNDCLKSVFKGITQPHKLVFNRQKQVAAVGDMEGEILSAVAAMQSLGVTKMTSNFFMGIPYLEFDLTQLKDDKKLIFLGDILDRGPLGMVNLVTLFKLFENPNPYLEKTFILGNHDLPYLLLSGLEDHIPFKLNSPSIFSVEGDPNFSLACDIFKQMNEEGYLKLAEYDPDLAQLTCHAVFTAGDHGFLKKFQNFLSQSTAFQDFLISKKGIDQKIVDMLIADPDFSKWKEQGPDHSYMQQLVDVINCLIDKDFIKENENRIAVLNLLMGGGVVSFVFKKGISIKREEDLDGNLVKAPYADFNEDCFPLPCIRQLNGHWPSDSRDPGLLTVETRYGDSEVVKLDCATSSQMLPGGSVAYPVAFFTDPDIGFFKINVSYQGEGFNISNFLNHVKISLEQRSEKFDVSWTSVAEFSHTSNDDRISNLASIDNHRPTSEGFSKIPVKAKILLAEFLNSKFNRRYVEELNSEKISDLTTLYEKTSHYNRVTDTISFEYNGKTLHAKVDNVLEHYLSSLIEIYDDFNSKL